MRLIWNLVACHLCRRGPRRGKPRCWLYKFPSNCSPNSYMQRWDLVQMGQSLGVCMEDHISCHGPSSFWLLVIVLTACLAKSFCRTLSALELGGHELNPLKLMNHDKPHLLWFMGIGYFVLVTGMWLRLQCRCLKQPHHSAGESWKLNHPIHMWHREPPCDQGDLCGTQPG